MQQRLRADQIGRIEALREPGVDRREKPVGGSTPPLLLPHARKVERRAQLQRAGALSARNRERLLVCFRCPIGWSASGEQCDTAQAVRLSFA